MKKQLTIELSPFDEESELIKRVTKKIGIKNADGLKIKIAKKSIDARHKSDIKIIYNVIVSDENEKLPEKVYERLTTARSVAVVGAGPAGLFCALTLARHGIKPIVFERGERVEERTKMVNAFFDGGELNTSSNVQFGEGGAGAFSDGKLNTQVNSPVIKEVLQDFVKFGAPSDILYLSKPHIGSDNLPEVVKNIRNEIISLGGEFYFSTKINSLVQKNGCACGVKTEDGRVFDADSVVLAIGHSARDTFFSLHALGIFMEQKEFAVGVRVEQLQSRINLERYGEKFANAKSLPPADYKLVSHPSTRGVFTFCMCPGGVVVPAASEEGETVVNGMSNYKRDGINANSAVICQVVKKDFLSDSPLAGVMLQREIERKTFLAAGDYKAPVQLALDFINGVPTKCLNGVLPTYRRGFEFFTLEKLFPEAVSENLKAGLFDMDKKLNGFASDGAVLTGSETRTSSPVRITRNEYFESVSLKNLYPCGEGCGYAGGIASAAADGVKVAEAVFNKLRKLL